MNEVKRHNHVTRDVKPEGECPACDASRVAARPRHNHIDRELKAPGQCPACDASRPAQLEAPKRASLPTVKALPTQSSPLPSNTPSAPVKTAPLPNPTRQPLPPARLTQETPQALPVVKANPAPAETNQPREEGGGIANNHSTHPVDLKGSTPSEPEEAPVKREPKKAKAKTKKLGSNSKPAGSTKSNDEGGWDEDNPAYEDAKTEVNYNHSPRGIRITPRDLEIFVFLARFRYAQGSQLARYVGTSRKSLDQRLSKLGKAGLLRKETILSNQAVWTLTSAGLAVSDTDFPVIGSGKINPATLAHTLGLVNLAINLEKGVENILELDDFGSMNRVDPSGELVIGETVISEREIKQGQNRWKSYMTRTEMERAHMRAMQNWIEAGDLDAPSPESEVGNEPMLILWANRMEQKDHTPDLVVVKPRHDDGKPANIAIELELSSKPMATWERIMSSYAEDNSVYEQVHYFTHKRDIKRGVETAARRVGLTNQNRFHVHLYTPLVGSNPFWG